MSNTAGIEGRGAEEAPPGIATALGSLVEGAIEQTVDAPAILSRDPQLLANASRAAQLGRHAALAAKRREDEEADDDSSPLARRSRRMG